MPALFSKKFRLNNAKQFVEAFDEDAGFTTFANTTAGDTSLETNMYVFIGGISAFTDDTNPPTPTDSVANSYYENWRDMIAAKKVTSADVSHCITRTNWVNNTNYFAYTHANNALQDQSFYVMTDEYNVYKCLANNNGSGTSQAKPTGTGTAVITPGADGYKWKFMYTISASKALKFATTSYLPVQQVRHANAFGKTSTTGMPTSTQENENQRAVEVAAITGELNIINKTAAGTNYIFESDSTQSVANTTQFTLHSGASGTNDIYVGSDIFFTSGDASGMGGTITDYVGGTKTATIGTPLAATPTGVSTFVIAPKVTITGDGVGANARAIGANSGQVTSVTVINPGNNYTNAVVTFSANSSHGSGATAEAIIEPYGGHGYDAVEELGGYNVMVNTRLENDESGAFTVANDFRKIGLLRQPLTSAGAIATATTADQAVTITTQSYTSSSLTYVADQTVTGARSGATGKVVDFNSGTNKLRLVSVTHGSNTTNGYDGKPGSFQTNEALTVSGGDPTANTNGVAAGALKPFSGDILYVENRSPVSRASDQIEDVKLIINF